MKRLLNSIFYCLFLFVLIMPVFSENISLSQDDLTKLQTLLNQSIQNNSRNKNEEKNQNDVIVKDSNFELIMKTQDQIKEVIRSQHDILTQKPSWAQKDICDILRILTSSEYYKNVITDFDLFKNFENTLDNITDSYLKFSKELRYMIDIFRIIDYLTKNEMAFFEKIQAFPNAKIMSESSVNDQLSSLFSPLMEYAPDDSKTLIRNFITKFVKTKFGTEPRIPSYVIFGILNNINESQTDQFEKLEIAKKQFFRNLDSLIDLTNELLKEIGALKTSDRIAPNIIVYLDCLENCFDEISDLNQNAKKAFNEYTSKISTLYSDLNKIIENCINSPKNSEIFDFVEKN